MFQATRQQKQRKYLDPIHGPIQLNIRNKLEKLLISLIDTKEFQRLRRIRQMGTGWFTFHGAEHSRFGHSLGTLFIAKKMVNHLAVNHPEIKKYKAQILISALLHDTGHGPFSHTSEKLTNTSHETWTKRIILGKTEINSQLKKFDSSLPVKVVKTLGYCGVPLYVSQIVSSYIDCDRLDYLLRDSYYVGVPYGLTGSDRIISSLEIDKKTKRLVVNESIGLDPVIHYLHARYSMYQQIYQHKKNLSSDFLLKRIVERIETIKTIKQDIFKMDDVNLLSTFQAIQEKSNDRILKDLCERFFTRKLFKSFEFRKEIQQKKIKKILNEVRLIAKKKGFDPDCYAGIEESATKPYEPYKAKGKKAIFIKQKSGKITELSRVSNLVNALSRENVVKKCLVFAHELESEVTKIKDFSKLFK